MHKTDSQQRVVIQGKKKNPIVRKKGVSSAL